MERTLCKRCVLPHSPPDVVLDDAGICNICHAHDRDRNGHVLVILVVLRDRSPNDD